MHKEDTNLIKIFNRIIDGFPNDLYDRINFVLNKELVDAAVHKINNHTEDERLKLIAIAVEYLKERHKTLDDIALDNIDIYLKNSVAIAYLKNVINIVIRDPLPWNQNHIIKVIDYALMDEIFLGKIIDFLVMTIEMVAEKESLSQEFIRSLIRLKSQCQFGYKPKLVHRISKVILDPETELPIIPGEIWAEKAILDIYLSPIQERHQWETLLGSLAKYSSSKPSSRWFNKSKSIIKNIGCERFYELSISWLNTIFESRVANPPKGLEYSAYLNPFAIMPVNARIIRGIIWLLSEWPDISTAQKIAELAVPSYELTEHGVRAVKIGNACMWSLGHMKSMHGITQLLNLRTEIKNRNAQSEIEKALIAASESAKLSRSTLEELSVPDFGLKEVGTHRFNFGDIQLVLEIGNSTSIDQRWLLPSGKTLKTVPKVVKDYYGSQLNETKQLLKNIKKAIPIQRTRIENLYLQKRIWNLLTWKKDYLNHPLVGVLARKLIWLFYEDDRKSSGIWREGDICDVEGGSIEWLSENTKVELWHPINATNHTISAWREYLLESEIKQPFKQAHREIYIVTDAEQMTNTYSNRFAAHILKQHQFHALCAQRGWQNSLRLIYDESIKPPAFKLIPEWQLKAEFWVENLSDGEGQYNEMGTYLYVSSDQVRFVVNDASNRRQKDAEIISQKEIPALVFSEVMRDVDLFVGVSSVGNDPRWIDGVLLGDIEAQQAYWHGYGFGELSQTAQTRKQVLEKLIPRLKIHDRCELHARFLVVKGDLRTYKIHLGSSNILMEPNDQYLCIVTDRSSASRAANKVFLPFEGDTTLSTILSKAFLLANDKKITDATILSQIGEI